MDSFRRLVRLGTPCPAIRVIRALAALTVVAIAASPASGQDPAPPAPTWTIEAEGKVARKNIDDQPNASDPNKSFYSEDDQLYRAKFRIQFRITREGIIDGHGRGEFQEASWHLYGKNGADGQFDCTPPVTGLPFNAAVGGLVQGRVLQLELQIDAQETNPSQPCGGNYTANAGTTRYLEESLKSVALPPEADYLRVDMNTLNIPTLTKHEEQTSGSVRRIQDHEWKFSVKRSCGDSTTDPEKSDYINQYDLGASGDVFLHKQSGGDACGPSSLVSAANGLKPAGTPRITDFQSAYDMTVDKVCGGTWCFDSAKGRDYLASLGYQDAALGFGVAYINAQLGAGKVVIASTTFGNTGNGGGHVIVITGRTQDGNYVVNDPAGDWATTDPNGNRYGKGDCGGNTVYTKADVESHANGRWAIGVSQSGGDPLVLGVVGRYEGGGNRPYDLLLKDRFGRRSGFRAGNKVLQLPRSYADLSAPLPTDPGLPPGSPPPPENTWPYAVSVADPTDGTKIEIRGHRRAKYALYIYAFDGGRLVRQTVARGTISPGKTKTVAPDFRPPSSRVKGLSRTPSKRTFRSFKGTSSDKHGVRAVEYTVQDRVTGRFFSPSAGKFSSTRVRPLKARITRGRGRPTASWTAKLPSSLRTALKPGGTYLIRVFARDRAGNREAGNRAGRSEVQITVKP